VECARERCLLIESRLNRNVDQGHTRLTHQLFGVVNALVNQPLVSRDTERVFERAGKVADGKSAFACNVRKPDPGVDVLMKKSEARRFCHGAKPPFAAQHLGCESKSMTLERNG
jgi:hypothetical protein